MYFPVQFHIGRFKVEAHLILEILAYPTILVLI